MNGTHKQIFIVITQTGTMLSRILKRITGAEYNHASLSLSQDLTRMYSFGRRHPYNPFWGGFVIESPHAGTFRRFSDTTAIILAVEITEERYAALLRYHDASWINLWNATSAYYHALRGETDSIPEIFSQHRLSDINMLAPGKPMMEMIENQVYLAQGAYVRVVGYSAELLPVCEAMHYALVALHLRIQTAVAYEKLGKSEEAHAWLRKALSDAEPDGLVMPFVENYDILKPLLEREVKNDLLSKIIELGEAATARNAAGTRPAAFDVLTPREFEIVELMAQRLSNREIAEQLFLSEGSVKQYVNQIYSKLHIEGDTRTKRKLLAELLR